MNEPTVEGAFDDSIEGLTKEEALEAALEIAEGWEMSLSEIKRDKG